MKKIILSLLVSNALFAGIPVFDETSLMKQVDQWSKEAERWSATTEHYKQQITAYANQLAAQTGIRDVQKFIRSINNIYQSAGSSVNSIKMRLRSDRLSKEAEGLMKEFLGDDNSCDSFGDQKDICKQAQLSGFEESIYLAGSSKMMSSYVNNINRLRKQLDKSQDIKESSDINTAIQGQIALMEAEKTQIELYQKQKQLEREALYQRLSRDYYKKLNGVR